MRYMKCTLARGGPPASTDHNFAPAIHHVTCARPPGYARVTLIALINQRGRGRRVTRDENEPFRSLYISARSGLRFAKSTLIVIRGRSLPRTSPSPAPLPPDRPFRKHASARSLRMRAAGYS